MVIEEIIIKNFQSHSNTHLYLSEGVNAIVGDTDSGKSSLFRALTWLFRNRPIINIEEYQSKWGGDVHVAAKYNGTWIGRVRNKSKNYYYIGEDIEVNRLEGFGNGPPPQKVVDLLNLGDVNFMSQQALPFLLSQGSGAIGRFLNEAANLDVIDRSTAFIASVLKKEKAELESTVSLSEDTIKVLKEFDWVDRADEALSALETLSKSVEENDKKIIALDDLLNDIDRIEEKIENIQDLELLNGAPLIEPQNGIYLGKVNDESSAVNLINENNHGKVNSYISIVITDNDLFLFSDEYKKWLSYSIFNGELSETKDAVISIMKGDIE